MQSFDQQLQMPHPTLLMRHGCWDRIMKIDPKVYMYSDNEIICLDWTWTWILDLAMAVFAINFCFLSWNKVQQRIVSGLDALHCLAARNPG